MMNFKKQIVICGLVLFCTVAARSAESLSVLLQKGIFAEETEGNLDAAIKIYEGIVKEGDANRSLVAQAQYRLGVCELKRGKREEAVGAFRKLIDQFSDAAELVAKSRERLTELGLPAAKVTVRQIWSGKDAAGDSISPDGRYLAFIDWNTGNLVVRDLATGQNRRLTSEGSWDKPAQYAESCAFSPDGKQIAYSWYGTNDSYGLRVVSLDGAKPRVLMETKTNDWLGVQDWSPDGKWIAVFHSEKQGTNRHGAIFLIGVADGVLRKVIAQDDSSRTLRFSPDGHYLAYDQARNRIRGGDAQWTNDIYVVDIRTGSRNLAVEYSANERLVGWAPGGSELLFTSEQRGTAGLWSAQVENGKTKVFPKLLKGGLENLRPLGITREGAFFYSSTVKTSTDIYAASMDFETGKLLSWPKQVPIGYSSGTFADPSPSGDGRFIGWLQPGRPVSNLLVRDLVSGELREYPANNFTSTSSIRFSPNNDHLLIRGFSRASTTRGTGSTNRIYPKVGHYLLNRSSGEMITLTPPEPQQGAAVDYWAMDLQNESINYMQWEPTAKRLMRVEYDIKNRRRNNHEIPAPSDQLASCSPSPDGKYLFYISTNKIEAGGTLWRWARRNLSTGDDLELLRSTNRIEVRAFSTNLLAAIRLFNPDDPTGPSTVKVIDVLENAAKEIFSVEIPARTSFKWGWFGRKPHLLFTKTVGNDTDLAVELWTIAGENGETKKTELSIPRPMRRPITNVTIASNINVVGENQIYFAKWGEQRNEIWVMENFLPPVAAGK